MSTSLRSVPEVRLSQINEAREKSNLIKRTLISILNGETTEDAALLRECEELGLIRTETQGGVALTLTGNKIAQYESTKDEEDLECLGENSETTLSSDALQDLLYRVRGTVLGHIIDIRILKKGTNLIDCLGVAGFSEQGSTGQYLKSLEPRKQLAAANVLRGFFTSIRNIRDAFLTPTTNKVAVNCISARNMDAKSLRDLVLYSIKNYRKISGDSSAEEFELVSLDFISDIDFSGYSNANEDELTFFAMRYIMTGKNHDFLNSRPPKKSGNRSGKTIKEQIDGLTRILNKNSAKKKVYTLNANNGAEERMSAILKILDTRICFGLDSDFGQSLERQPILFLGKGLHDNSYEGLRRMSFSGGSTPNFLPEAVGMEGKEKENITLRRFLAEILAVKGISIAGVDHYQHALESMQQQKLWKGKEVELVDMLYFILGNTSVLPEESLIQILQICSQYGMPDIPGSIVQICTDRFQIGRHLFERYKEMQDGYRPSIFTPKINTPNTVVRTTGVNYLNGGIKALGMDTEVDELIAHLERSGSVLIADNTGYSHGGTAYTSVSDRLLNRLVWRIMKDENAGGLKHHSVIEIEVEQKSGTKAFITMLQGGDPNTIVDDIAKIHEILIGIVNYNPDTVIILNLPSEKIDPVKFDSFIELVRKTGLKIIIQGPRSIPGVEGFISINAFSDREVRSRIISEIAAIQNILGVKMNEGHIKRALEIVSRMRNADDDPLDLSMQVLQSAATNARANNRRELSGEDVAHAASTYLDMTNTKEMLALQRSLRELPAVLNHHIVGQSGVIDEFCARVELHTLGGSNPDRPYSVLIPGPTGVGKTWMAEVLHKHFNLPLLTIDGSMYKEPHSVARLSGSPPGYQGSDEGGLLTNFMDLQDVAIVFIDELDKMHPEVRMAIMNFIDEGKMTCGDGRIIQKRRYIIIAATNAGAEKLHPGMGKGEIVTCISEAFKDENGIPKPEFANRFTIMPMLGVEEQEFRRAIRQNLALISMRPAVINQEITIERIGDSAVDLIFNTCNEVCRTHDKKGRIIEGFKPTPENPPLGDTFFNLREISRAIDSAVSLCLVALIRHGRERKGKKYALEADSGKLALVEIKE